MTAQRMKELLACIQSQQEVLVELPDGTLFEIAEVCIPDNPRDAANFMVTPVPLP